MRPRIGITLELGAKGERRTSFLDLAYAKAVTAAGGLAVHFASIPSPEIIEEPLGLVDGLVLRGGADISPSFYREEINASVAIGPAERVEFDLRLFRAALKAGKPILAICHGMQIVNIDGSVKSPSAALPFTFVIAAYLLSTPHSSCFGRLASGAFYAAIPLATFYEIINIALGGALYQDIPSQFPGAIPHRGKETRAPARHTVRIQEGSHLSQWLGGLLEFEVPSLHHQAVKGLGDGLRAAAASPDGLVEGIEFSDHSRVIGVQWHPEEDPLSEPTRRLFNSLIQMASRDYN